jgi:hypothetical protein
MSPVVEPYGGAPDVPHPFQRLAPLILLALLACTGAVGAAAPGAPGAPRSVTAQGITLAARPAYEGGFRPGSWMPIVFDLENAGVDRAVELRIGARDGAQYGTRVDLPNGGRKQVTVYAYLTPASRRLTARLLSDGQELAAQPIALQPVNPSARVVGLLAPEGAAPRPPARLNRATPLVAVPLRPADMPEHALGLSGFGALVIEDVATADLSDAQRAALQEWVLRGGQLILAGGPGLERVLAGLPPELAPFLAAPAEPVAAESLFGSEAAGLAPVPYAELAPRSAAGRPEPYSLPLPSLGPQLRPAIEQTLGRGTVTALAFPLSHPALAGWAGAPELWSALVRAANELPAGFAPENVTLDSFVEGNMAASLTSLPALEFPPLGLLAGLVGAYIVLVGPVTYLVLRRLDRQSLGWVVVPAITALFAALTYGVGHAQRGGDVMLNQITLVEPIADAAVARVRSFVGVFSPQRRSYELLAAAPSTSAPLLRPISVQGPWDSAGGAAGGVFMQDVAAGAGAEGFEIAQWSMRALTADQMLAGPVADARVIVADEGLLAEVRNTGAAALRDVAVVQGERVARLGEIAPGETKRGELKRRQPGQPMGFGATTPVSYLVYGEEMDRQSSQGGQPLPVALQQRVRILDALYNYGPSTRGGQPLLVAWADTAALDVAPAGVRADEQHTALVTLTPRVELEGGKARLGPGWLTVRFEGGPATACFGGQGTGVTLGPDPAVIRLTLPRELYALRPERLTLLTASDSPWPEGATLELFDWTTGAWEPQQTPAREIAVPEPERFLSSSGSIRARVASQQAAAGFGCVYVDARIEGALP